MRHGVVRNHVMDTSVALLMLRGRTEVLFRHQLHAKFLA
jgi:hypothetical protein